MTIDDEPVLSSSEHSEAPSSSETISPSTGTIVSRATLENPLMAASTFDVWSFGNVLYELVSRQPLFVANGDDSLQQPQLLRLMQWSLVGLSSALDDLRAALRSSRVEPRAALALVDCVAWCLQPDADARPQSMSELLAHNFFDEAGELRMREMHVAAALGDVETIERLSPASVDERDPLLGKTPLHLTIAPVLRLHRIIRRLHFAPRTQHARAGHTQTGKGHG